MELFCLVSDAVPDREIPWNFLDDQSVFCSNEVTWGCASELGLVTETPSHPQKPRIFSPISQSPERGAYNGEDNQPFLCDDVSITVPKAQGSESSQVAAHEGAGAEMPGEHADAPPCFP